MTQRQQIAPKKIYCIDSGLSNAVGFGFSPNTGRLLENLAFLSLRRHTREIYYYTTPGGYEVDFYLPQQQLLVLVTQDLDNPAVREREVRALTDAVRSIKVHRALILCDTNEDGFKVNGVPVEVRSAAEWLLRSEDE